MRLINWQKYILTPKTIRMKQLQSWLEQIQLYLNMGYCLIESLQHIHLPEIPKHIHHDILYQLKHGTPIDECFKKHPHYFDEIWVHILAQSSNISLLFQSWISQLNSINTLHRQLQQQLFYPGILFLMGIVFLLFFKWFVFPQYQSLYNQFNVIDTTSSENLFYLLFPLFLIVIMFKKHLPFFNILPKLMYWYRFICYLNIQNQQGKTFYQSIQSAIPFFVEHPIHPVIQSIEEQLRFGQSLQIQLPQYLPHILQQTLSTHHSPNDFQRCQQLLEMEIKYRCKKIELIIQPLMLLSLAGLCSGLIVMVYQPIIKIGQYF